ncbi:gluconokinase [Massilia sp. IC2-477]|uniref:gluconokinase n=1 Tax=Massilia sp. IC2-477 TaxID=2887198 RepID=UPI001D129936|nr:gluconokinase [Massilia sp. IC2-477]MCC2956096.1 gluconokinase [Massilia sp. IC2-477]
MNPPLWVVMGVSGCGKSDIGRRLAQALQARFIEGDAFHPPENVTKMAAGVPLTDEDRRGWLLALRAELQRAAGAGEGAVLSCSALKRIYRDVLRGSDAGAVCFVHLTGPRELIAQRMAARSGHFMPVSLLDSQLRTLEPLQPDECGLTLDLRESPARLVEQVLAAARTS